MPYTLDEAGSFLLPESLDLSKFLDLEDPEESLDSTKNPVQSG